MDTRKKLTGMAAIAMAGLLAAMTPAWAQTGSTSGGTTTGTGSMGSSDTMSHGSMSHDTMGKVSAADKRFMTEAAQGGMEEVELGKLAAANGADADVKTFGQRMVDDHTKANDQLKQVAQSKGVTLPTEVTKSQRNEINKLSKMTGASFDKAYMKMMVKDHKKDVAEFQKESKSAKDTDVKSFAGTTLPTLEEHLQMAETTAGKVGAGGNTQASMGKHHMKSSKTGTPGQ